MPVFVESQEAMPDNEVEPVENIKPARETGSIGSDSAYIAPSKPDFPHETPETPEDSKKKEIDFWKENENKPEKKAEKEIGNLPESRIEPGAEASPGKEAEGRTDVLPEEKPVRAQDTAGKTAKAGQKRRKGKPAALRQYNLGDYL